MTTIIHGLLAQNIYLVLYENFQITRRLRERGEPIQLFGETEMDTFQRLKKIEMLQPEINKVIIHFDRVSSTH